MLNSVGYVSFHTLHQLSLILDLTPLNIMSTSVGRKPKPLTAEELKKLLDEAIESGAYCEKFHARYDHVEREIDLNDVLHGLARPWSLDSVPKFDEDFWNYEYEVKTETIEGESLTIIVAVDPRNRSFEVITRWINDN